MIKYEDRFSSSILLSKVLVPNTWNIDVHLIPNHSTGKNYNIALDRLEYYINEVLDNSIIISPDDVGIFASGVGFKGKIIVLPDEPYDHLLSIALYTKFNSILEKVFFVESVSVTSYQGEGITHTYDSESGDMETLINLINDPDIQEYVDYWYKPDAQCFIMDDEGMELITTKWHEVDLNFTHNTTDSNVVKLNIKPRKDDDDNIA